MALSYISSSQSLTVTHVSYTSQTWDYRVKDVGFGFACSKLDEKVRDIIFLLPRGLFFTLLVLIPFVVDSDIGGPLDVGLEPPSSAEDADPPAYSFTTASVTVAAADVGSGNVPAPQVHTTPQAGDAFGYEGGVPLRRWSNAFDPYFWGIASNMSTVPATSSGMVQPHNWTAP
jgi:hypothetical protein